MIKAALLYKDELQKKLNHHCTPALVIMRDKVRASTRRPLVMVNSQQNSNDSVG